MAINKFVSTRNNKRPYLIPFAGELSDGSTLSLDFIAMEGTLDSRLTFTRASDATFVNSSGLVQYADANHVQNSTMLNNTGSKWSQTTSGGSVTINGDETVRFNGTGGRATWLQSVGSLSSGLPMTFSFRVTSFTNTNLRTTDLFNAGTGFTGQSYFYTDTAGTTHTLTAFESLPKSGTNGVGTYSVTAITNATTGNIIFGSDCNGVGSRNGDVTITAPQLQYGTVVPRLVYVPNSSIASAKWDSARFDYNPTTLAPRGLLIQGSATNLLQQSADYSNAYWNKVNTTIETTSVTCPDNISRTTVRVKDSGATNVSHSMRRNFATSNGTTYTLSFWVKKGSTNTFAIQIYADATFNTTLSVSNIDNNTQTISGGTGVNASATRVAYPNGWYRYAYTFTASSAAAPDINFHPRNLTGTYVAVGDHTDFFGIQLETGSVASSYIPTGASTVQRAADVCRMTGANFSSWFNNTTGTFFVSGEREITSDYGRLISANSGSTINYIDLGSDTAGRWNIQATSTTQANITAGTVTVNTRFRMAGAFAANSAQMAFNGTLGTLDTTVTVPTVSQLDIGVNQTPIYLNGRIQTIKFWPTRLPDATLQSLTQ